MSKKKIKVRVKKRKINIKRILIFLLILILIILIGYYIFILPIKNIYIVGNDILSDKEIIEISKIDNYPSFLTVKSRNIRELLKSNVYIKDVDVKKRFFNKLYIYITERKILCIYNDKLLLDDAKLVENKYKISDVPILVSDISGINYKFVSNFSLINNDILLKISEIEYSPNDVDNERFILKMNDGNLVYITLNKLIKLNKYNSIYSSLEGKKGIIYLDSGDYVEIKEE